MNFGELESMAVALRVVADMVHNLANKTTETPSFSKD
jgi:hypothetical protein